MQPTLLQGALLLCVRGGPYRQGDIVIVRNLSNPSILAVKRLVALEGEDQSVFGCGPGIVQRGMCLLLGDNRRVSGDSRTGGPFPLAGVVARMDRAIYRPRQ